VHPTECSIVVHHDTPLNAPENSRVGSQIATAVSLAGYIARSVSAMNNRRVVQWAGERHVEYEKEASLRHDASRAAR